MSKFEDIIEDILLVLGFLSLCFGISLIYTPAMFIVAGVLLLWAGIPKKVEKKGGDD